MEQTYIKHQIQLVEDQLENLCNSGHYTEKEISKIEPSLIGKREYLKRILAFSTLLLKKDLITNENRVKIATHGLH